jgi:hypothetical protein
MPENRENHPAPAQTDHWGQRVCTPQPAPQDIKPGGNFGRQYESEQQGS